MVHLLLLKRRREVQCRQKVDGSKCGGGGGGAKDTAPN
jgi:hypothetical protein